MINGLEELNIITGRYKLNDRNNSSQYSSMDGALPIDINDQVRTDSIDYKCGFNDAAAIVYKMNMRSYMR